MSTKVVGETVRAW